MKWQKTPLLLLMGIVVLTGSMMIRSSAASADSLPAATITANCVDATAGMTYWNVANSGPGTAEVTWTAGEGTSTYTAPFGNSKFATVKSTDSTPMSFSIAGQEPFTVEQPTEACVQPETSCVDGTIRSNLEYDWSEETGTVTLRTVNSALLCNDVTVYLSTYVLPANYDNSGIFDDSSLPQTHFDSATAVLQKNTTGDITLQVKTPDACTPFQMDIYYAPEIVDVPYTGHGAQLIYGNIHPSTQTDCTPGMGGGEVTPPVVPVTPGMGGGEVTPPVVVTATPVAAKAVQAAPQQLTNTGTSLTIPMISAIMMLSLAIVVRRTQTNK
jgi:hypothetical protein